MKNYNFKLVKRLIKENKINLSEAAIGMHEDWWWTAENIWKDGKYIRHLPNNADQLNEEYIKARKNGLSMFLKEKDADGMPIFNPEYDKCTTHLISGLYGSSWATPVMLLTFKDGSEKFVPIYQGENDGVMPEHFALGCLSQPVQDNITPILDYN